MQFRQPRVTNAMRGLLPSLEGEKRLRRLRAVIALDDDEVGCRVRLAHLNVGLVFRRVVAGDRGLVVGEFDHDVAGAAGAFDGGELAGANDEAATPFLEDRTI